MYRFDSYGGILYATMCKHFDSTRRNRSLFYKVWTNKCPVCQAEQKNNDFIAERLLYLVDTKVIEDIDHLRAESRYLKFLEDVGDLDEARKLKMKH